MTQSFELALGVLFALALLLSCAGLFVYGTWFKGVCGGRFDISGLRQTDGARRHERRVLLIFVIALAAGAGTIAASPEARAEFCPDTPIWPGCDVTQ